DFEASRRRVAGVPGHVVRSLATDALAAAVAVMRGRRADAFDHELRARFAAGFITGRVRHSGNQPNEQARRDTDVAPANDRVRVSVVIPCYNQARFLRRAIESAL